MGGTAVIYSVDRVKRLRVLLWLTCVTALGVVAWAFLLAAVDDHVSQPGAALVASLYLGLAGLTGVTLWQLHQRDRTVKVIATVTGAFTSILGVLYLVNLFGMLSLLLGVADLALAMLPDDPDLPSRGVR